MNVSPSIAVAAAGGGGCSPESSFRNRFCGKTLGFDTLEATSGSSLPSRSRELIGEVPLTGLSLGYAQTLTDDSAVADLSPIT